MHGTLQKAINYHSLTKKLTKNLKGNIEFLSLTYIENPYARYISPYYMNESDNGINELPIHLKLSDDEFIRVSISSSYKETEFGEKLAALSDFYEALKKEYGEPTLYYTIKNDEENSLNLQWSFIDKEQDIAEFKNNTYFADVDIDELIIINKPIETMKQIYSRRIGLPFDLIHLIDQDRTNYFKHKKCFQTTTNEKSKSNSSKKLIKKNLEIKTKKTSQY